MQSRLKSQNMAEQDTVMFNMDKKFSAEPSAEELEQTVRASIAEKSGAFGYERGVAEETGYGTRRWSMGDGGGELDLRTADGMRSSSHHAAEHLSPPTTLAENRSMRSAEYCGDAESGRDAVQRASAEDGHMSDYSAEEGGFAEQGVAESHQFAEYGNFAESPKIAEKASAESG